VTGSARQYLDGHPDANQAAIAASNQPDPQAAATLRDYFSTHPQEYSHLRGILAPIDDTERQCHVTALPSNLESAYHQFMAG
jgi:hemophore-related protein